MPSLSHVSLSKHLNGVGFVLAGYVLDQVLCPAASAALGMEYKAGVNMVSCAWPHKEDEIAGSYLNIKMPFSLLGVHISHMNEHEATVIHPGLIINTDSFPKQILRSHCVRVSAELSLARGSLPSGESTMSAETCHLHWHVGRATASAVCSTPLEFSHEL